MKKWREEKEANQTATQSLFSHVVKQMDGRTVTIEVFDDINVSTPFLGLVSAHAQEVSKAKKPIGIGNSRYKELYKLMDSRIRHIYPKKKDQEYDQLTARFAKLLEIAEKEKFGQQFTWDTIESAVDTNKIVDLNILKQQAQLLLLLA